MLQARNKSPPIPTDSTIVLFVAFKGWRMGAHHYGDLLKAGLFFKRFWLMCIRCITTLSSENQGRYRVSRLRKCKAKELLKTN